MTLYNITIFSDLRMEEDVTHVTTETGCKYYCYAQEKFLLFQNQICVITIQYKETVHLKPEREKGSEFPEKLSGLQEKAASLQMQTGICRLC